MTGRNWTIRRDSDGGETSWFQGPSMLRTPSFSKEKKRAQQLPKAEAEQLAEDWQSWSDTKGAGYRYSAEPIEEGKADG